MTRAKLNATVGRLTVEGAVDLQAIRREGRAEDYTITPVDERRTESEASGRFNPERIRVILSGISLLAAYISEELGAATTLYLPLYTLAIISGGWGNARKAFFALPRLNFNMSVLMTVAVLGAAAIGEWAEGAVVAFLYSVSEMLEAWTMQRARRSIRELMDIAPKVARIRRASTDAEVPVEDIVVGDVMVIRPGEKIAMDGRISKGESAINEAAITGESVPTEKGPGAEVFAGTLNINGALEVEVTRRVQDTTIAKIIHMVEEAQAERAPSQAFVDRFAAVYTPLVIALAAAIALLPPIALGYEWGAWVYRGLALLVVACPCALVVSTPVSIVSAISNAARNGVLVKGGVYLEAVGALRSIAFDKTGTLTRGEPVVTDLLPLQARSETELLQVAVNVETHSEHPLALAIVRMAEERGIRPDPADDFSAITGRGATGVSEGRSVYIGNLRLYEEQGVSIEPTRKQVHDLQQEGKTAMIVGSGDGFLGIIAVADEVRKSSKDAILELKRAGIERTVMLTGDNEQTARAIAAKLGVDDYRAELLPEDKVAAVKELNHQYGEVAMVGDGINDAPALATATVGIAMGGAGTDTALETADIALMADDLSKLPFAVRLSRSALRVIKQNIGFSLVIKLVAVLAVFPGWLTLWLAIIADMGATILVTLNGIRLLRLRP